MYGEHSRLIEQDATDDIMTRLLPVHHETSSSSTNGRRYGALTLDEMYKSYAKDASRSRASTIQPSGKKGSEKKKLEALNDKLHLWVHLYDELKQIKGVERPADNWILDLERKNMNFWDPIPENGVIPWHVGPNDSDLEVMYSNLMQDANSRRENYPPFRFSFLFHHDILMPPFQTRQFSYLKDIYDSHLNDAIFYRQGREEILGGKYMYDKEIDNEETTLLFEHMDQALIQAWDIYCGFRMTYLYLRATFMQTVTKINNQKAGRDEDYLPFMQDFGDTKLDHHLID